MEATNSNDMDMQSLEEGRLHTTNNSNNDVISSKSQRTVRSRKPRRRNTVLSNNNRQRANSSFQYPSSMSVFSTGASVQSPAGNSNANVSVKPSVQEVPPAYQYEIVPTTFPHPQDTQNDSSNQTTGNQSDGDSTSDNHNIPKTINNGSKVIVRPKQIHQNPLTPTMLPKGFTPINEWGRSKAKYHKEWLAEFVGTLVMTLLGDGCSLQNLLGMKSKELAYQDLLIKYSDGEPNVAKLFEAMTTITQGYSINVQLGWGGAVLCGYFAAGGSSLSGAHLNMCVTLSNFFFRGSPNWKLVLPYILAQLLGAYVAGLLLFGYYKRVIEFCYPDWQNNQELFSAFVTIPVEYLSPGRQFIGEAVASMFLIAGIFAMTDPYNNTSNELFPLYLFILIYTLMASMSLQTEAAINFGRDLGPRLALWTVGASRELLFDSNHHYFWVPIVGPVVGGLWGAFLYDFFIFRGHESWVNRPLYQNIDSIERKWYKIKRLLNKKRRKRYSEHDDDDSDYDSEEVTESYVSDSDTEIGDGSNSVPAERVDFDSIKEDDDEGELSDSGDVYDRMSLSGLDAYSLNDIPEESMDDIELKKTNSNSVNKPLKSILYDPSTSNTKGGAGRKTRAIGKRDIHFKSNGKNRRFVPTL